MKKRNLALLAAATITCTLTLGLPVYAEEDTDDEVLYEDSDTEETTESYTSGDYTYTLKEDGTAEITAYAGADSALEIPAQLDGIDVTEIGGGAFANKSIVSVTLPATLETLNDSCFFGCGGLAEISVAEGNTAFQVQDGVLLSADGSLLYLYPQASDATSYTVPDGVAEIWSSAFAQTTLTEIVLPDGLLYIDDWAFSWAQLTALDLPSTVTEIGQYAFAYCTGLTEVDFPEDLELIEAAAFAGDSNLTRVSFGENLTDIQMASFAGTGLTEVTIPENVTAIGFCAFGYEEDMETTVDDFVVYGTVGSQAQTYCTDSDSDNDYENNFTFRSVLSEETDGEVTAVEVTTKEASPLQTYGKWILLGVGALVLLGGGLALIFSGKKKKPQAAPETADAEGAKAASTEEPK